MPKPRASRYDQFLTAHGVEAAAAAMFEDMPHNLEAPHALGMTTVLVRSTFFDHPSQRGIAEWRALPAHVHYITGDLTGFLGDILAATQPAAVTLQAG